MDAVLLILFFILAFLLFFGVPFGLAYFTYRFIKKKDFDKRFRLIALFPILFIGFILYRSFYPGESFFRDDFKEVTSFEFPDNGKFLFKTATFPDHFGDYTSTAITSVDEDFYRELPQKLLVLGFKDTTNSINPNEFHKFLSHVQSKQIDQMYTYEEPGKYFVVCFLSDKKSLLIQRVSW